jgi:hypothetical protein
VVIEYKLNLGIIRAVTKVCIPFVVSLLAMSGCDDLNKGMGNVPKVTKEIPKVTKENRVPVHRFVITRNPDVAFDTQTGQICRTWEWMPVTKPAKPNENGMVPQRMPGELSPTCISLYTKYPSGVSTQSEALVDEQPSN